LVVRAGQTEPFDLAFEAFSDHSFQHSLIEEGPFPAHAMQKRQHSRGASCGLVEMEHSSVSAEQFKDADTRHDAMLPIIGCGNSPPLVEPLRLPKLADMLLWDPHHQFDEKRGEGRRNPEPLANHIPLHVFPQRTVSDDVYTETLLLGLLSESFNGVDFQMESEGLRLDSTRSV